MRGHLSNRKNRVMHPFISNTAHGGGGLVLAFSTTTLQGNIISYNAADGGGGLDVSGGSVTLSGNIVISNTAYSWGGGLYVDQGSNATLINVTAQA